MPYIVRNMTDDEAILAMTDDNLRHREKILPTEKAQSLKMQVEAIKHQGARPGEDAQEAGKRSTQIVGNRNGMNYKQVQRYIRLDFFLETVRRYTDATTITRRMVGELIDHIDVYHAEKQDGITNQRVVIHYNCIGAFDVPDRRKIPEADIIMETRKGVALSYTPAQIAV